jgi:hypothetical protein
MARKSRKNTDTAAKEVRPSVRAYDVGAYVRLSAVDKKQKGDSIENQQAIIAAYCAERSDLVLREVYIDNGLSGQSFERPAFQRMLADLESGKINCCISKDAYVKLRIKNFSILRFAQTIAIFRPNACAKHRITNRSDILNIAPTHQSQITCEIRKLPFNLNPLVGKDANLVNQRVH